jgi:hypothetical protein
MGMYDHVKYKGKCPNCGSVMTDWQTKDGMCVLSVLDPEAVDTFYAVCEECGKFVVAKSIKKLVKVILRVEEDTNVD